MIRRERAVRELRERASQEGEHKVVALCDSALGGDLSAIVVCERLLHEDTRRSAEPPCPKKAFQTVERLAGELEEAIALLAEASSSPEQANACFMAGEMLAVARDLIHLAHGSAAA